MVVIKDDRPLRPGQFDDLGGDLAFWAHGSCRVIAAIDVGAGVSGVGEDAEHPGVGETPPSQLAGPGPAIGAKREPPPFEGGDDLIGRSSGAKGREHVGDRRGDLSVRVYDRGPFVVVDEPDREGEVELAAFGGGQLRAVHPAGQKVQLRLRHRALQPERETVVEVRQVVDPVGVDDQGVGEPGQLQQPRKVGRRARQARHLETEDGTDLS
jgi:hypothetical protein